MHAMGRGASDKPYQHGNDPGQKLFAFIGIIDLFSANQNIKACGTFQGRATRNVKESTAISLGVLAIAFRDVERDGRCGPVQLTVDGPIFRGALEYVIGPDDECKGLLVNIEFFVIE